MWDIYRVYFVDYERGRPSALALLKLRILTFGRYLFHTVLVQFQAMRYISYAE